MDWTTSIICYAVVTILALVGIIIVVKRNGAQEPIDDSQWNFDMSNMKEKVQKFVSGKEVVIAILGINNIAEMIKKGMDTQGFCLLTEKAFYFIGKNLYKRGILAKKDNTQRRINAESYRAICVKKKVEYKLVVLLLMILIHIGFSLFKVYELLFVIGGWESELISIAYIIIAVISLLEAIFCIANINVSKSVVIEMEFTNEKYIFSVNQLGKQEIKTFYRQLSSLDAKSNI